ncbi:type I-E CRISPR-associated protein Cas7/Cse4/CasC [Tritonibacter multivorans]|uniref:type I-E CRISPR-associated protein Cas7/Cse4/CasC n=1 Tax=Tritonibacter multivorans TaxID=928856 RepID=UPI0022873DA2|nr:type I-E CRISPR-associated protein Cas7/Cse4/CasC [Tritonibacter multivorans]MDA7423056.1 type I-E CRISPR-associated protein Cas7/Cse4/CasC [Tritonibacter multivorans]
MGRTLIAGGGKIPWQVRETIEKKVFEGWSGGVSEDVLSEIKEAMLKAVYGEKATSKQSRQTLLLGEPEVAFLKAEAQQMAENAGADKRTAKSLAAEWLKTNKSNLKAMSSGAKLPAGLAGALFGRMVTSDPRANIDAALHVAHAFTVHAEEVESDYFVAVDDLAEADDTGADTIQETELTSGLFYGYVVVDLSALHLNLGGDVGLMGEVLHNLIYLIAEVSPGAKLGSTAPYSRASFMLLEAGDRQPRSLADAYRVPCRAETSTAVAVLCGHLAAMDQAYETGETRHVMSLSNREVPSATRGSLRDLAAFAKSLAPQEAD